MSFEPLSSIDKNEMDPSAKEWTYQRMGHLVTPNN